MSPSVYILIPVHNRKAVTLTCLENLQRNGDLARYQVVVIDDGSIDGTAEAIQANFPQVTILQGDGNLWWTGAIVKGMVYAYERGADFFIWLNDDTLPISDALLRLVNTSQHSPHTIVTAQCYADLTLTKPTYGGRQIQGRTLHFLSVDPDSFVACDVCSGNLVCLPRSVVDKVGYPPSRHAPQTWGDVVYTWRAKQAGFKVCMLGSAIAICPTNPLEEGWASSPITMTQRWKQLRSPKSSIYPPAYWFYCRQVYGLWGVLPFWQVYFKLVLFTLLRWIIPQDWIMTVKEIKDKRLKSNPHRMFEKPR
jgi:GT2 family glycosyltransferase